MAGGNKIKVSVGCEGNSQFEDYEKVISFLVDLLQYGLKLNPIDF